MENGEADTSPSTHETFSQFKFRYDYSMALHKNQWYNTTAVKRPDERGDAHADFSQLLLAIGVSVAAEILSYYIIKWLESK